MHDYVKSSCFKGDSNEYLEKKTFYTGYILLHRSNIFFASFQKAAFIMAIVVQVSNMAYGPLGLSYESVYVQLFNSEHPESEPCEDRKYLRSFKTLNRHIAVSSFKKC